MRRKPEQPEVQIKARMPRRTLAGRVENLELKMDIAVSELQRLGAILEALAKSTGVTPEPPPAEEFQEEEEEEQIGLEMEGISF